MTKGGTMGTGMTYVQARHLYAEAKKDNIKVTPVKRDGKLWVNIGDFTFDQFASALRYVHYEQSKIYEPREGRE